MKAAGREYSSLQTVEDKSDVVWRRPDGRDDLELSVLETDVHHHGLITEEALLDDLKV